jgi:hypothetical protein
MIFGPRGGQNGVVTQEPKLLAGLPGSTRLWVMLATVAVGVFAFLFVTYFVFGDARGGSVGATDFDRVVAHFLQSSAGRRP